MLLPRTCIVCGKNLLVNEIHICLQCAIDLPLTYFWDRTHNPMADRFNEKLQEWLDADTYERYAYASALFFYNEGAEYKNITRELKYNGNIPAGRYFAGMLGRRMASREHFRDVGMVIPVPLHWKREWSRGYNQAEVIAKEIAESLGAVMRNDILERVRNTKTQTRLDIEEKAANVKEAFAVRDRQILLDAIGSSCVGGNQTGHILLVDDVFTTGATLNACFIALRQVLTPEVRISIATLGFVGE
jgi:ComF family protein